MNLSTHSPCRTRIAISLLAIAGFTWRSDPAFGQATGAQRQLQQQAIQHLGTLRSGNVFDKEKAAAALNAIDPRDLGDVQLRKEVAQAFRKAAFEPHADDWSIEGLVHWGGKHSVPLLIELLEREEFRASEAVMAGLAKHPDPRTAEALTRLLGDFFQHESAVRALRKLGPVAEDALIEAAPSNEPKISFAAVELLGDVGTEKSVAVLRKAIASKNRDIRDVAKASLRRVLKRAKKDSSSESDAEDSPFNDNAPRQIEEKSRADSPGESLDKPGQDFDALAPDSDAEQSSPSSDDGWGEALSGNAEEEHVDRSEVELLLPGGVEGTVVADGQALDKSWPPKPVRMSGQGGAFPRSVTAITLGGTAQQPRAAAVYDGFPANDVCRIELLDLRRRKGTPSFIGPKGTYHADFSPSGNELAVASIEDFMRRETRLSIWSTATSEERLAWTPYPLQGAVGRLGEVSTVVWLTDARLLTISESGNCTTWDVAGPKVKAIYQIDATPQAIAALSPGRSYFALSTPRGVEVFASTDGKLLARMHSEHVPRPGNLAFDATGKRLALVRDRRVTHWDAVSGQLLGDFYNIAIERNSKSNQIAWLGEDLLLIGTDLVDLTRRAILWRYGGSARFGQQLGAVYWNILEEQGVQGLIPVELPHQEALAARERLQPSAPIAVKPGQGITLDNQIADENRDRFETAMDDVVKRHKLDVSGGTGVRLVARLGETRTEEATYRRFGESLFSAGSKVTVETGKTYEVVLEIDGKPAWNMEVARGGMAPMHVRMKEGESIEAAVQREATERNALGKFTLDLPHTIVHPDHTGPIGTSELTLSGVQ